MSKDELVGMKVYIATRLENHAHHNEVRSIRRIAEERSLSRRLIAKKFGVSLCTVKSIIKRETWKSV